MKRFLIPFFLVIFVSLMIIPSYAAVGGDFNGESNLLIDSTSNYTSADFIPFYGSYTIEDVPLFSLDLNSSSDYSFVADNSPSDRLLIAPVVDGVVYGYESPNLLSLGVRSVSNSFTLNGISFSFKPDGSFSISGTSTANFNVDLISNIYLPNVPVTFYNLSGSDSYSSNYTYHLSIEGYASDGSYKDYRDYGSGVTFTGFGNSKFYISIRPGATFDNFLIKPMLSFGSSPSEFHPIYPSPIFIDDPTSLVSFITPSILTNFYAIGILDSSSAPEGSYFSRITSSNNNFYLIPGEYSFSNVQSDLIDLIGDTRYNEGYDSGYSVGQTDGIESSNTFPRLIYTVLSAPFVVISNTLNFEIFGLNVLNLVKVVLTIMIVAFVFTRLKGRE